GALSSDWGEAPTTATRSCTGCLPSICNLTRYECGIYDPITENTSQVHTGLRVDPVSVQPESADLDAAQLRVVGKGGLPAERGGLRLREPHLRLGRGDPDQALSRDWQRAGGGSRASGTGSHLQ